MITDGWLHGLASLLNNGPAWLVCHGPGWSASPSTMTLAEVTDEVGREAITLTAEVVDGELLIAWDGLVEVDVSGAMVAGWVLSARGPVDDDQLTVFVAERNDGSSPDPFPLQLHGHALRVRR